eukprot:12657178-Alexandrium_andersonii.AAC.1
MPEPAALASPAPVVSAYDRRPARPVQPAMPGGTAGPAGPAPPKPTPQDIAELRTPADPPTAAMRAK